MVFPSEPVFDGPSSSVLSDMGELFDRVPTTDHGKETLPGAWAIVAEDDKAAAWYKPGNKYSQVELIDLELPLQGLRWAAIQLYAQLLGGWLLNMGIFVGDPAMPEEEPIELKFDNSRRLAIPEIFSELIGDGLFDGVQGKMALAGLVGATDLDSFLQTWNLAEAQGSPLESARMLLEARDTFYSP